MTSGTSGIMLVVILEVELMGLIALQIIMFKINIEPQEMDFGMWGQQWVWKHFMTKH